MDLLKALPVEERTVIEQYVRSQARVVPGADGEVLVRVLDSFLMYVSMKDTDMAPHLVMDGYWEMWATIAVARYVKPGMRCLDLGAGFGYYTLLLAALVGESGKVEAWEPAADMFAAVRGGVEVNGFRQRVNLVNLAASDERGTCTLYRPPNRWGSASLAKRDERAIQREIERTPVDAEMVKSFDFIKMDVEGHEAEAWAGMRETLATSPGVQVMLEFTPEDHEQPEAFLDEVSGSGFGVNLIDPDGEIQPASPAHALEPGPKLLWLRR
jgi:FkbM family methyltransferase